MFGEQPFAVGEIDDRLLFGRRLPGPLRQAMQDIQHRVDRGQDVRLGSPERGKPHRRQPQLQRAEIAATEGQVMQEVPGAVPVVRVNLSETWLRPGLVRNHVRPNGREFTQDILDVRTTKTNAVCLFFTVKSSIPELPLSS